MPRPVFPRRAWPGRPAWFVEATHWITEQLDQIGVRQAAPIEQMRTWERPCVLRTPTSDGELYFKAVLPMFRHEPPLTAWCADRDPLHFPRVVAIDEARGWMLMRAIDGTSLDPIGAIERWEVALRTLAQIQIDLRDHVPELIARGCPNRSLEALSDRIDAVCNDRAALQPEPDYGLSNGEIERLQTLAPRFEQLCAELAAYDLPRSLEHGDLWSTNVIATSRSFVFFDWSDCSIAHPFWSVFSLLDAARTDLPRGSDQIGGLRAAYLHPWRAHAPSDRLEAALAIAQVLVPLHHAALYHDLILPRMHPRWQMQRMVVLYLRQVLDQYAAYASSADRSSPPI